MRKTKPNSSDAKEIVIMAKYKITLDREGCISDAICSSLCPENWYMAEDGKANFKKEKIGEDELECNKEAAKSCPTGIIKITKID